MLKVFEAFAGYGSQSIALRNLGIDYEVVAISEIDKYAIKAYEAIHGEVNNLGDISKLNVKDIPRHDLFTYSFPCQDISVAGKQKGVIRGETRSGLLYECERIIEGCKPKYLLMENVKNLVGKKHKPQFDEWLQYLETLGYTNYWQVLNAKDYGVPQNRERVFVVSILGEHEPYKFPEPIKLDKVIRDILDDKVEEKYYINKPFKLVDKGRVKAEFTGVNFEQSKRIYGIDSYFQTLAAKDRGTNNILIDAYLTDFKYKQTSQILNQDGICTTLDTMQGGYREPKILCENIVQDVKVRKYQIDIEGLKQLLKKSKKQSNTITASQQDICYIDKVERTPLKFLNRNGKQAGEDYCFCVDTTNTGGIKETYNTGDFRVRKLTPRECFRLMGMYDVDIDKIQATGMSNSQQYKMAGNSIVVDVLEGIFRELFLSNNNQYNTEKVILGKEEVEQLSFFI